MAMARSRLASSSGTALAAVIAPTSEWPATTSATASRAVSNTRIFAARVGAAGVADHLRHCDVIGIAERGGERDRDGVLRQASGQVGAAAEARIGANDKRDVFAVQDR